MLVLSNQFFSVSALSLKLEWMVACFFSFAWLVVHLYKRICVCVCVTFTTNNEPWWITATYRHVVYIPEKLLAGWLANKNCTSKLLCALNKNRWSAISTSIPSHYVLSEEWLCFGIYYYYIYAPSSNHIYITLLTSMELCVNLNRGQLIEISTRFL